tara:strand:- start:220 stop:609 length:390 start_codon:yes stop_codon:yes gene_type:complete
MMTESWTIEDNERPWTLNAERRWHYHKRARIVKETRERFAWLALEAKIPKQKKIRVTAVPLLKQRNSIPDVAACFPAVKAAIDGIVDAGTIPDDDPSHLVSICFHAPEFGEKNGLRVTIHKHDTGEDDE